MIQILSTSIQQFLEKFELVEIYNSLAVYIISYCNLERLGSRISDSPKKKPDTENGYITSILYFRIGQNKNFIYLDRLEARFTVSKSSFCQHLYIRTENGIDMYLIF